MGYIGRLVIGLLGMAAAARAAIVPFDFAGHWVGVVTQDRGKSQPIVADLAGTRTFDATATVEAGNPCTGKGRQKPRGRVVIHLACGSGDKVAMHGTLDAAAAVISASYVSHQPHKHPERGTLTLTRQ